MILRRDKYTCQVAARYGKRIPANTVHHVFPREVFPEYEWESWNLLSVSETTHNELHDRNTGGLTRRGIELLERIGRANNIDIEKALRRLRPPGDE